MQQQSVPSRAVERHVLLALAAAVIGGCGGSPAPSTSTESLEPRASAFGTQLPRAPVEPLEAIGVPDVNEIGLLEGAGGWTAITRKGQRDALRVMGKALFWDMQVGGDGIQACASCHFHAGADNRITNQINPGRGDLQTQLVSVNGTLQASHYLGVANGKPNAGFAVDEATLLAAGATSDASDGSPGAAPSWRPGTDINDIASSQGVRAAAHRGVTPATHPSSRVDTAVLAENDSAIGFDAAFQSLSPHLPATARRVPGRNSPSVLNAIYNLRNFWDGRANMYFNGVNPFGVNDPAARVKVWTSGGLGEMRLDIPFSSLASQAVGPIGNSVEMSFEGRPMADLGKKLTQAGAVPLKGQFVDASDSLLGPHRHPSGRGLATDYATLIRTIFEKRFWGNERGLDICLDENGNPETPAAQAPGTCPRYSLMQWNFPLFFGLAVQAYEARLTTGQTMVDLLAGGIAKGTVVNGSIKVPVEGIALEGCIAAAAGAQSAGAVATATELCTTHYAKFLDPGARTGSESSTAPLPVPDHTDIGGKCGTSAGSVTTRAGVNTIECRQARNSLLNVNEGLKRFFSGNTACSVCHVNPEFTGATVSAQTRFGARLPALPNGQLRKELEARAVMERMLLFNGSAAVYDVGFYNLGVRPTVEDIAIGDRMQGVPLAFSRMARIAAGGATDGADAATTRESFNLLKSLTIPTSPADLTPQPFPLQLACGPGLVGAEGAVLTASNNPVPRCVLDVRPGERLQVNGSFKTPGLRNVRFTGPYFHNGSKLTIRQVLEFYKTGGHFGQINRNNLDAGMRQISIARSEESALVELMETGLTDWRVAYKRAPFDHPELCLPHGHLESGASRVAAVPAVGAGGTAFPIATFAEMLGGADGPRSNDLSAACTVPGVAGASSESYPGVPGVATDAFTSLIDWILAVLMRTDQVSPATAPSPGVTAAP